MQSQQKRVKWSRGETAEALEERTDTGITQASVELMENCIPDIYGNISRRPGFKTISNGETSQIIWFDYDQYAQIIPFYITEDDYILICIHFNAKPEFIRIKNGVAVWQDIKDSSFTIYPVTGAMIDGTRTYKPVSYAQQNNYMLIADANNVYKIQLTFSSLLSQYEFTALCEVWKFSAGWYAANGTQTKEITGSEVVGLNFDASSVGEYIYTEENGTTTVYSWISTGIASSIIANTWTGPTTTYYVNGTDITGTGVTRATQISTTAGNLVLGSFTMTNGQSYNSNQSVGSYTEYWGGIGNVTFSVELNITASTVYLSALLVTLDVTNQMSSWTPPSNIEKYINIGSIVQFPNNGAYMRVEGFDSDGTHLRMYGSFLTPIADDQATDDKILVEYNYISLQPTDFGYSSTYPHPTKLTFLDQRLWAGGWATSTTQQYSIVIGSQIARYTDFKNDYNQTNEPITLDILTKFKEKILHLIDYNGLKIMTEAYEYAYIDGRIVKQSANGSFEYCEPLVFDSLCLYIDSTGCQVKAMQYEFQTSVFNSTTINQMAPHDLVRYPWCMAQYEDKYNSTGKYLFLVNRQGESARLAVCNFVPGNQAEIWNRWGSSYANLIHSVVNLKDGMLFMLHMYRQAGGVSIRDKILPAVLDFNANSDIESSIATINGVKYFGIQETAVAVITVPNTTVNVYSNGEFKFTTTTGVYGQITADLTGLTNVTVGLPINARVVSHPIDVGGKTKTIKKRIGKTVLSVHNTEANAITINGKTGYINPQKDKINFYGVTGMKDEIKYTLTNINGAKFTIESATMNIEYGTLIS